MCGTCGRRSAASRRAGSAARAGSTRSTSTPRPGSCTWRSARRTCRDLERELVDNSLPPVPDIVRSAYATLIVTSLEEARRFWVDLLGFVVTYEDSQALYLRGYDELTHHHL